MLIFQVFNMDLVIGFYEILFIDQAANHLFFNFFRLFLTFLINYKTKRKISYDIYCHKPFITLLYYPSIILNGLDYIMLGLYDTILRMSIYLQAFLYNIGFNLVRLTILIV